MHDDRQRVHRLARHQYVQLHQRRLSVTGQVVIQRCVPARHRFQPVVKIHHDLVERQVVDQQHAARSDVLELLLRAPFLFQQLQDLAQVLLARDYCGRDDGLLDPLDLGRVGELGRIVYLHQVALARRHPIAHARRGGDQVDIELALQPLLHDVQVQQPQETAAEAEAQRRRVLGLEAERAVVQPKFLDGVAQHPVLVRFHRVEAREHHRLHCFEARQRLGRRVVVVHHGVADLRVRDCLDVGEHEAHLARRQLRARHRFGRLVAQPLHLEHLAINPQPYALPDAQRAVHHPQQRDHATVGIEPGIEDQRAQRRLGPPFRRRDQVHDGFQNLVDARALFRAHQNRPTGVQSDHLLDLLAHPLGLGHRQVDLVDHRNQLEIVVQRQVGVGQRLRLDALRGVHHQQRPLAGLQAARHFVAEIHVPRRVDQVQLIQFAVLGAVVQPDRVALDGDAPLAFQVHAVQDLLHHLALGERSRHLQQPVRQRRFAVVDVSDDGEVTDVLGVHAV